MTQEYLAQAVKKLRTRSYSTYEIREYLLESGAGPAEAEVVVERLQQLAYLNDSRLAQELYEAYRRGKPCGYLLWREKLRQRGIDQGLIDELASDCDPQEEYRKAKELTVLYLKEKAKAKPAQRLRGLAALLARRGFSEEVIEEIIREQQMEYK